MSMTSTMWNSSWGQERERLRLCLFKSCPILPITSSLCFFFTPVVLHANSPKNPDRTEIRCKTLHVCISLDRGATSPIRFLRGFGDVAPQLYRNFTFFFLPFLTPFLDFTIYKEVLSPNHLDFWQTLDLSSVTSWSCLLFPVSGLSWSELAGPMASDNLKKGGVSLQSE